MRLRVTQRISDQYTDTAAAPFCIPLESLFIEHLFYYSHFIEESQVEADDDSSVTRLVSYKPAPLYKGTGFYN